MQAEVLSMKDLKDAVEESSDQEASSAKKQVFHWMKQLINKHPTKNELKTNATFTSNRIIFIAK